MSQPHPTPAAVAPADALKLFNEFQAQSRARGETTLRLVLVVSGGMLTLSIGAVLGNSPPKIPSHLLPALQWGWGLLFYSIAASLLLMCSMIVATFHMGVRWHKELQKGTAAFVFIATWSWLRIANAIVALSVLCSCLAGIALMAYVALGVASALTAASAPVSQSASIPATAPNPSIERTDTGRSASAAHGNR